VTRGLIGGDKVTLAWNPAPVRAQEQGQAAAQPLPDRRHDHPRGGVISVDLSGQDDSLG